MIAPIATTTVAAAIQPRVGRFPLFFFEPGMVPRGGATAAREGGVVFARFACLAGFLLPVLESRFAARGSGTTTGWPQSEFGQRPLLPAYSAFTRNACPQCLQRQRIRSLAIVEERSPIQNRRHRNLSVIHWYHCTHDHNAGVGDSTDLIAIWRFVIGRRRWGIIDP